MRRVPVYLLLGTNSHQESSSILITKNKGQGQEPVMLQGFVRVSTVQLPNSVVIDCLIFPDLSLPVVQFYVKP